MRNRQREKERKRNREREGERRRNRERERERERERGMCGCLGEFVFLLNFFQSLPKGSKTSTNPSGSLSSVLQFEGASRPPRKYRRLRFNYGRLGMDEFDFSQYNRTKYASLEHSSLSSYINSILQCLFFIPQVLSLSLSVCVCLSIYLCLFVCLSVCLFVCIYVSVL